MLRDKAERYGEQIEKLKRQGGYVSARHHVKRTLRLAGDAGPIK